MEPLKLFETSAGWSLLLSAGATSADDLIESLGHEPNGYFWAGLAELIVSTRAPHLAGRFNDDPEAGTFVAYGPDQEPLAELGTLLATLIGDHDALRELVTEAESNGFDFDD